MKEDFEIDCRKCDNCDMEIGCCKLYGNDPEKAVKACAANCFAGYKETPHTVAEIMCWKCGARWIAAYPSATLLKDLQCPGCHNAGHAFLTGQDISEE